MDFFYPVPVLIGSNFFVEYRDREFGLSTEQGRVYHCTWVQTDDPSQHSPQLGGGATADLVTVNIVTELGDGREPEGRV